MFLPALHNKLAGRLFSSIALQYEILQSMCHAREYRTQLVLMWVSNLVVLGVWHDPEFLPYTATKIRGHMSNRNGPEGCFACLARSALRRVHGPVCWTFAERAPTRLGCGEVRQDTHLVTALMIAPAPLSPMLLANPRGL